MSKTKNNKIFVMDTSVILYDHKAIYNFEDNDVVIPITVFEELDEFKRIFSNIAPLLDKNPEIKDAIINGKLCQ